MTKTNVPTLDELELHESAGRLERCPTLRRVLARKRAERDEAAAAVPELELARRLLGEHERRAAIEVITLPTEGADGDAMILSLRGTTLATEERDGRRVEFKLAGVIGFIDGETWTRIGEQVRESLRRAHRSRPREPEGAIVVEPGKGRDSLLELVGEPAHRLSMARSQFLASVASELPANSTTRRWYRLAIASHDEAAASVAHGIFRAFQRAGRIEELAASQAAE